MVTSNCNPSEMVLFFTENLNFPFGVVRLHLLDYVAENSSGVPRASHLVPIHFDTQHLDQLVTSNVIPKINLPVPRTCPAWTYFPDK